MLDSDKLPKHIALIPDGNRRWAREHGLPPLEGHRKGLDSANRIIEEAWKLGVPCMTLWAFSTENWDRDEKEVAYLMDIFSTGIESRLKSAKEHKARIIHLGRKDRMNETLRNKIVNAEQETAHFTEHYLSIALDYGGKDEILRAIQKLVKNNTDPEDITPQLLESYLDTHMLPYPNPDLILRTGGEQRTSGFMVWQNGYSELMFVNAFLPAFTVEDFLSCIEAYQKRKRRFGK